MKMTTLSDVIYQQNKNKKFRKHFERESLINEIANLVVQMRRKAKMTQKKLAEKAGTTQPVIARLEGGADERIPSLDLLIRIASATNTNLKLIAEDVH